jgi:hypothetical protein
MIMVLPCIVNSWSYCSGVRRRAFGPVSCSRMISASMPPANRKRKAVTM